MVSGFDFDPKNDPSRNPMMWPGVPEALRQGPAAKVQEELHQGNAQDLRNHNEDRHGDTVEATLWLCQNSYWKWP